MGFWTGAAATALGFFKAADVKNPVIKVGMALVTGALIGGGAGTLAGMGINKLVNMFAPKTHTEKVLTKQIDQYKESNIKPLEEEIKTLEKELKAREEEFYE